MAAQPIKQDDPIRIVHDVMSFDGVMIPAGGAATIIDPAIRWDYADLRCPDCGVSHRTYATARYIGDYGQADREIVPGVAYDIPVWPCAVQRARWRQVSGDVDASTYGGTYAKDEGQALGIYLVALCPMQEYVGDEAAPSDILCTTAWYDYADLDKLYTPNIHRTYGTGIALEDTPRIWRAIHLMEYGEGADSENDPSGWRACVRRYLGLAIAPSFSAR